MSPQRSDAFSDACWSPDPLILQCIGHALSYYPVHSVFPSTETSMHPAVVHTQLFFNKQSRWSNNSDSRVSTHRDFLALCTQWHDLPFPLLPWKPLSALGFIKLSNFPNKGRILASHCFKCGTQKTSKQCPEKTVVAQDTEEDIL